VTAIPLGRPSRKRLGATHPHTPAGPAVGGRGGPRPPACAYLVLLRAEIARFTPGGRAARVREAPRTTPLAQTRLCCSDPRLRPRGLGGQPL